MNGERFLEWDRIKKISPEVLLVRDKCGGTFDKWLRRGEMHGC